MSIPRILTFHKLCPAITYGSTNYSPGRFRSLLKSLSEAGYRLVSLQDALDTAEGERAIAVTFDDGYEHLAKYLPDIIREFSLRPTLFIPTQFIGKASNWDYTRLVRADRHLDKAQIRELAGLGVEIGAHGHSHVALTELTGERLEEELMLPRRILEDVVGCPVTRISYPFGRISGPVIEATRRAGYSHGFTTQFPSAGDPPLATGRHGVWFFDTPLSVRRKLEPGTWFHRIERIKADVGRQLSAGTGIFNRLTGYSPGD